MIICPFFRHMRLDSPMLVPISPFTTCGVGVAWIRMCTVVQTPRPLYRQIVRLILTGLPSSNLLNPQTDRKPKEGSFLSPNRPKPEVRGGGLSESEPAPPIDPRDPTQGS